METETMKNEAHTGASKLEIDESLVRKLTDGIVVDIARMQKQIDHLDEFLMNLHINIVSPTLHLMRKYDDIETYDIWNFIEFIKTEHPEIIEAFKNKAQQEQQELIRQQREQRAKKPMRFWKRPFDDVPRPQSSHQDGK